MSLKIFKSTNKIIKVVYFCLNYFYVINISVFNQLKTENIKWLFVI